MISCYLCNGVADTLHNGVRDDAEIDVLKCRECGLVFLSSIDHINETFYEDGKMLENDVDIDVYILESEKDDLRRYKYLENGLAGKTVLDFGCGAGGFLSFAEKTAKLAHGVEPNKLLFEHINRKVSKRVKCFMSLEDAEEKYDIITLFHVLEHIKDPVQTLNRIADRLCTGGEMIIETPNSNDALLSLYESSAFADFTYWSCHLRLFNTSTLERLFKLLDRDVNIDYINQVQRYPLSNHLYWLSKGEPGGQIKWSFMNNDILNSKYEAMLSGFGYCDTLIAKITFS